MREIAESEAALTPYFQRNCELHPEEATMQQRLDRVGLDVWLRQEDGVARPITLSEAKKVWSKMKKAGKSTSPNTSDTSSSVIPKQPPSPKLTELTLGGDMVGGEDMVTVEMILKMRSMAGRVLDGATAATVQDNQQTIKMALERGHVEQVVFLELFTQELLKGDSIETTITDEEIAQVHRRLNRGGGGPYAKPSAAGVRACMTRFARSGDGAASPQQLGSDRGTLARLSSTALLPSCQQTAGVRGM